MESTDHQQALDAARQRRDQLKQAISKTEFAASAPSGNDQWRSNLLDRLEELRIALDQHVDEVEGSDGLLQQVAIDAPRLDNTVNRVRNEHPGLTDQVAATIETAKEPGDPHDLRSQVLTTLIDLVRHRQRGADLIYEAYSVDIGGG